MRKDQGVNHHVLAVCNYYNKSYQVFWYKVWKAVRELQLAGAAGKHPNLRSLSHVFKLVGWMWLWISYPTAIRLVASSHSISQCLINTLISYLFTFFWQIHLGIGESFFFFPIYTFLRVWDTVREFAYTRQETFLVELFKSYAVCEYATIIPAIWNRSHWFQHLNRQ